MIYLEATFSTKRMVWLAIFHILVSIDSDFLIYELRDLNFRNLALKYMKSSYVLQFRDHKISLYDASLVILGVDSKTAIALKLIYKIYTKFVFPSSMYAFRISFLNYYFKISLIHWNNCRYIYLLLWKLLNSYKP